MKLLFAHRKQRGYGNFSIENYFQTLSYYFEKHASVQQWEPPYYSNGIFPRLWSIRTLRKFVRKQSPDLTHITGDTHFLIWGISGGKRVLTIHDLGFLREVRGLKYYLLRFFWLTGPVRKAHAVTCVSYATKKEIQRHFPGAGRIHVIPTVVDPRFVRHDKPFQTQRPVILLLGSAQNKNLKRVLKATQGLEVRLSIVAKLDDEELGLLQGQVYDSCVSISFEELLNLYRAADIVALCSTHEGFGMPIIEAQVTGRVVITSDCSSMPEVAGKGALLVDPFSIESIHEGIKRVCSDESLRQKLITAGFENCKRFDSGKVANQYLELYRRLLHIK